MTTSEFQHKLLHLQNNLKMYAFSLTANTENAHDLLQETNLKALNYCSRFQHEINFKAWTFTIMRNTFINNYRRKKHFYFINGFEGLSVLNQIESDNTIYPTSLLESKELEKIIDSIEDKLRIPFKMQHDGYKYKEIAKLLNVNVGTVKSRIFVARKKLMKKLI